MAETDLAKALSLSIEGATPHTKSVFGGANAMSAAQVAELLAESRVALVSTIGASGSPHMAGVGLVYVGGKLYFGLARTTALYRNLRRDPRVAVGVVELPWRRHVLIQGSARFLSERGDEIGHMRAAERAKHGWESSVCAEVVIGRIFTWKE